MINNIKSTIPRISNRIIKFRTLNCSFCNKISQKPFRSFLFDAFLFGFISSQVAQIHKGRIVKLKREYYDDSATYFYHSVIMSFYAVNVAAIHMILFPFALLISVPATCVVYSQKRYMAKE